MERKKDEASEVKGLMRKTLVLTERQQQCDSQKYQDTEYLRACLEDLQRVAFGIYFLSVCSHVCLYVFLSLPHTVGPPSQFGPEGEGLMCLSMGGDEK